MKNKERRQTTIVSALQKPQWLKRYQKVIILRDESGSMVCEDKAVQATQASNDLIKELACLSNQDCFYCAVISFNCQPYLVEPFKKATEICGKLKPIDPSSGTDISLALKEAYQLLENPITEQGTQYEKPITVLFSDGKSSDPTEEANILKKHSELITIAFGQDADELMLKNIATSPKHFFRSATGAELRELFMKIGQTMSKSIVSGQSIIDSISNL